MGVVERIKKGWNAFNGRDPTPAYFYPTSVPSGSYRPEMVRLLGGNDRTIITSVYNQIAVDCSSIAVKHVRLGPNEKYKETINDSLNYALTMQANIDQSGKDLIKDGVLTLLNEGCVAFVPVKTDVDPYSTDSYNIEELRVGRIVTWYPQHVRLEVYDDRTGIKKEIVVEKRIVAIVENPFYNIMNEPNSTAKRLNRVLSQLDLYNSSSNPSKLDLLIQMPFAIKSEAQRVKAKKRKKELEDDLTNSALGIGFIDATEKAIQLNRSLENNLWEQAKDLTEQLFNQLGFSQSIFNGSADEQTMLNYQNRTLEPIMTTIVENMQRKWLTRTAQTQGQAIRFFKDPFKLVPVGKIAEIADKFTRNEIMTSNEIRSVVGMEPSKDPKADQLINSNLNHNEDKQSESIRETISEKIQNERSE